MWTTESRGRYDRSKLRYPSDLTDEESGLVDTQYLLMHAIVHTADIQDSDGGAHAMVTLFRAFPFVVKLYADGGYQGTIYGCVLKKVLSGVNVEIVKRSDTAKKFVVLPKR